MTRRSAFRPSWRRAPRSAPTRSSRTKPAVPYTVDPLGGSYYVETLTKEFEDRIWQTIREVDSMGGAIAATKQGWFQRRLAEGAYRDQCAIERGENIVVGVNAFKVDEPEHPAGVQARPDRRQNVRSPNWRNLRRKRDNATVTRTLDELRKVCASKDNVMPAVLDCVKAFATVGEIGAGMARSVRRIHSRDDAVLIDVDWPCGRPADPGRDDQDRPRRS